jgi:hypothetical protein
MTFLVIEQFHAGQTDEIARRFRERGRMMESGVGVEGSWIDPATSRCYMIVTADRREMLDSWIANWRDLVDFEVIPVLASAEFWASR